LPLLKFQPSYIGPNLIRTSNSLVEINSLFPTISGVRTTVLLQFRIILGCYTVSLRLWNTRFRAFTPSSLGLHRRRYFAFIHLECILSHLSLTDIDRLVGAMLLTYLVTPCSRVLLEKLTGFFQLVKNSPNFMERVSSLPHSQVPATCPYSEPARSSPLPHPTF